MKATGIVRRIDDLGRIVIPIEIRRQMKIRDGDPLEIYVDKDGEVILKKYSVIADLGSFAAEIVNSLHESTGDVALMSDRDEVVAVAGAEARQYTGRPIGPVVVQAMEERQLLKFSGDNHDHEGAVVGSDEGPCNFKSEIIVPVVVAGDPIGAIILGSEDTAKTFGPLEEKLTETAAGFLSRHMEE